VALHTNASRQEDVVIKLIIFPLPKVSIDVQCSSKTRRIMEQQTTFKICLLLLFTFVDFSFEIQQSCIPLNKCSSLMLLLRNRDDLPDLDRVDVYRHLQLVKCSGFQGNDPLVDCPDIEGKIPIWKKVRFWKKIRF
jgi:hypothetical protein